MTKKWALDIPDGMHHGAQPTRMLAYLLMHHICHGDGDWYCSFHLCCIAVVCSNGLFAFAKRLLNFWMKTEYKIKRTCKICELPRQCVWLKDMLHRISISKSESIVGMTNCRRLPHLEVLFLLFWRITGCDYIRGMMWSDDAMTQVTLGWLLQCIAYPSTYFNPFWWIISQRIAGPQSHIVDVIYSGTSHKVMVAWFFSLL